MFFKRIVAKLHAVSMTKEFLNPKKKQENTVKAITSGEPTPAKGAGKSKGKAPALPKGSKGKGKGKKGERSQTPTPSNNNKGGDGKKGNGKGKPALTQGKLNENQRKMTPSTGASPVSTMTPSVTPQAKPMLSKPGKIPRQCAYFASEGGCQKGEKCTYLHETEGGKPKAALPDDVAKLEARAKVNPALRPPSKPPTKVNTPVTNPTAKMLRFPVGEFDFSIYYDCQESSQVPADEVFYEVFYDCQEPPELRHQTSDTGDINPTMKTWPWTYVENITNNVRSTYAE